ncbi:MAG: AlkA N-terminal domain-containing protein, partial [Nesterenkonia sp.]
AAHEAGYRACKRCLPEATPGSPQWNVRQDLAGRAMRLIRDGAMLDGGVEALSARLGYSSRHIHREVTAQLGAGPLALDRAHRAQTARSLLTSTDLAVSDVAFASGFTSIRQFNQTLREIFDAAPGQIRARRGTQATSTTVTAAAEQPGDGPRLTLQLRLPVREPFDAVGVFGFLAQRAVDGVEVAELGESRLAFARTLQLKHGPGALQLDAVADGSSWRVGLRCELTSLADAPAVVSAARRVLDVDADPVAIDAALSQDPVLAPLVAATPGVRVPGTADAHEYLIRAIIGQQISVAAARTHLSRLSTELGTAYASSIPGLDRLFPTADQILTGVPEPPGAGHQLDPQRPLRLPARSIRTVRRAAHALTCGELDLHPGAEPDALAEQLTGMQGIGQWTASYLRLRTLGHPDTWMPGDVALAAGAKNLQLIDPQLSPSAAHRTLAARAERWSPWRSYAAMHLWKAAAARPRRGSEKGPMR